VATTIYFSAATIGSLSFGTVQPTTLFDSYAAAAETLIGFAILTMAITYVLALYSVVQEAAGVWSSVQQRSSMKAGPLSLLEPHFPRGRPSGLSALWRDLHSGLNAYSEGMRRYPVVYYFHIHSEYRSLPYLLGFMGHAAAAVRWGLPEGSEAAEDAWLPGLIAGVDDVLDQITATFLPSAVEPAPAPVGLPRFIACRHGDLHDDSVTAFTIVEAFMSHLAHGDGDGRQSPDYPQSYARYRQWWTFIGRLDRVVTAIATDFAIEDMIGQEPGR
jgi:hypothetical protein